MEKKSMGNKIKDLRVSKNITQESLARKLLVRVEYISRWENDHWRPSIDNLKRLARVFGTTVDELIE